MQGTHRPEQLEARLHGMFRERLKLEVPSSEVDLLEAGIVDSLTFVELLVLVEEEFGTPIDIGELELEDFRSIRRIARFLASHRTTGAV